MRATDGIKRLLCLAIWVLIWTPSYGGASEGESRTYAVISLIGDKISIVGHQSTTGSNMDRNRQGSIAVDGRALDNMAVLAAINAIKRLDARAATVALTSSNATLYELQNELFEPQDRSVALLAALKELVHSQNATHLVLIIKHEAMRCYDCKRSTQAAASSKASGFTWMQTSAPRGPTRMQQAPDSWRRLPISRSRWSTQRPWGSSASRL